MKSSILFILVLLFASSQTFSQVGPPIKVEKLIKAPDWFHNPSLTVSLDTLVHSDSVDTFAYKVFGGRTLYVRNIDHKVPSDDGYDDLLSQCESELKLISENKKDTVTLDMGLFLGVMAMSSDSHKVVVHSLTIANEDFSRGDILIVDLDSLSKTLIFRGAGRSDAAFSANDEFVAFSDFGNIYVYDISDDAIDCCFNTGGSFWLGSNWPTHTIEIRNLQWSPTEYLIAFQYVINVWHDSSEFYQIKLDW